MRLTHRGFWKRGAEWPSRLVVERNYFFSRDPKTVVDVLEYRLHYLMFHLFIIEASMAMGIPVICIAIQQGIYFLEYDEFVLGAQELLVFGRKVIQPGNRLWLGFPGFELAGVLHEIGDILVF